MAKTLLNITYAPSGNIPGSATSYLPLAMAGSGILDSTEGNHKTLVPSAGTLSLLSVYVPLSSSTSTTTVKTRKNGADGNMSVSIGSSSTGWFSDVTNTDTLAANDEIDLKIVTGSGSGLTLFASCAYDVSGSAVGLYNGMIGLASGGVTRFFHIVSSDATNGSTESFIQYKCKAAGTWKYMSVYVAANSRPNSTTIKSRKNGADGNMSVSITASTTGKFADVTNSDTIAVDDLINFQITTGAGGGTITCYAVSSAFVGSTDSVPVIAAGVGGKTVSPSTTYYFAAGGDIGTNSTENNTLTTPLYSCQASKLNVNVATNGITNASTLTMRKSGADGALTVSITGLTTGWFQDVTHTDDFTSSDTMCLKLVTGSGGTSMSIRLIGFLLKQNGTAYTSTLSDSVTLVDTIAKTTTKVLNEAVTLVAGLTNIISRSFTETVSLVASFSSSLNITKLLSENITLSDSIVKTAFKSLSETATMVDTVGIIGTFIRSFDENLTIEDVFTKTTTKVFTEAVEFVDSVAKTTSRAFDEAVTIVASVTNIAGKVLSEAVSLVDTLTRTAGKALRETATLADHISVYLNGILQGLWAKTARITSSWSSVVRKVSDWTKIDRE